MEVSHICVYVSVEVTHECLCVYTCEGVWRPSSKKRNLEKVPLSETTWVRTQTRTETGRIGRRGQLTEREDEYGTPMVYVDTPEDESC